MKDRPYLSLFVLIIAAIISLYACSTSPKPDFCQNVTVTLNGNKTVCIDIQGYVLGNIQSNGHVYLYWVDDIDYTPVMQTVNECGPIQTCRVHKSAEFNFTCLDYDHYVAAIPSTSYTNRFVGSPLVYQFKNENISINIVYKGGDYEYLVGAFNINKTHQAQP
ncbi:MAG: hypothetical protein U9R52_02995 [Candidatus Omnitrophota bacterium]|nr:hypothetical protein [Candidatus Omnitrophota bacterium]